MLAAFPVLVFKKKSKANPRLYFKGEPIIPPYHLRDKFSVLTMVKTGPDKWEIYHE